MTKQLEDKTTLCATCGVSVGRRALTGMSRRMSRPDLLAAAPRYCSAKCLEASVLRQVSRMRYCDGCGVRFTRGEGVEDRFCGAKCKKVRDDAIRDGLRIIASGKLGKTKTELEKSYGLLVLVRREVPDLEPQLRTELSSLIVACTRRHAAASDEDRLSADVAASQRRQERQQRRIAEDLKARRKAISDAVAQIEGDKL